MPLNELNGNHKHVTAQIRDFAAAVDTRIDNKISALSLATPATVDSKIAAHEAASDPHPSYMTDADVEAKLVDMLVAGTGIGLSYNSPAHHLTISQTGSIAPAPLTQSSLTYEYTSPPPYNITFIPSASDWAVNQVSILSLSTSNTFPPDASTETKTVIMTQDIIDGLETSGMSFTRNSGTYYARHWRVNIDGAIAPYSDTLTVVMPADVRVLFETAQAFGGAFGHATNPSFSKTWTISGSIPSGKKRYGIFTSIMRETINAGQITGVTVNGTSVTPVVLYGATGTTGCGIEFIAELPGASATVVTTMTAGPGRSDFSLVTVLVDTSKTLAVDARYQASNTTTSVAVTPTVATNNLAVVNSFLKFGFGPAALPVESITNATFDAQVQDTAGNLPNTGSVLAVGHSTTDAAMTVTTSPSPSTGITDHQLIVTVLKAV